MAHIENTTDHHVHFTVNGKLFDVPRSNGESGPNRVSGSLEVTDEELKAIQADGGITATFDRGDLVVGKAKAKPAHADDEKHAHKK